MIADFTIARSIAVCATVCALTLAGCASGKRASEPQIGAARSIAVADGPAKVTLQRRGPNAYLNATLASQVEIDLLVRRLGAIFGDSLTIEQLSVSEALPSTRWLDDGLRSIQNLAVVEELSIHIEHEVMRIGGWVESRDGALELIGDTHSLLSGRLGVEDDLDYPERVVSSMSMVGGKSANTAGHSTPTQAASPPAPVATMPRAPALAAAPMASDARFGGTSDAVRSAMSSDITTVPQSAPPAPEIRLPSVAAAGALEQTASTPRQMPSAQPDWQAAGTTDVQVARARLQQYTDTQLEPLLQDPAGAEPMPMASQGTLPEAGGPEPELAAALPMPSERSILIDDDGDKVPDKHDACTGTSRGSPVDSQGCPYLNGYLKNVRFYGQTDKLTRRAMITLDHLAGIIRQDPQTRIAVMSYTSNSGSPWEMRDKARMRAKSVVGYLVQMGVDLSQLQAYAFGHVNGSGDQIVIREMN